jgi:hypothetical protein
MLRRVRALLKKHRTGSAAPPTPNRVSRASPSTPTVPDFTPVNVVRQSLVVPGAPKLAAPVFDAETTKLPGVLHARRYAHLLQEARSVASEPALPRRSSQEFHSSSISQDSSINQSALEPAEQSSDESAEQSLEESVERSLDESIEEALGESDNTDDSLDHSATAAAHLPSYLKHGPPSTPSIGQRMKGFFFSYLPIRKQEPSKNHLRADNTLSLPVPPADLADRPRPPIVTPVSKPPPAPAHPKDLVDLQHAPEPLQSRLPRRQDPKRLVDLRHIEPEPTPERPVLRPRSSNGSVKDLVRVFEDHDKSIELEREARSIRRMKSSELSVNRLPSVGKERPAWKP